MSDPSNSVESPDFLQIFFCKPPLPGLVKTRLGQVIGMARAAHVYRLMLSAIVGRFPPAHTRLYSATSENLSELHDALPQFQPARAQTGDDLGARMANALMDEAAITDAPAVLLVGTDIPDYTPEIAMRASELLRDHDLVFGPARDGGYYLVGMSTRAARDREKTWELFREVPWSTPETYARQQTRARDLGFSVAEVPTLDDVDTIEDLGAWRKRGNFHAEPAYPDLRVVLPVYNEAENLEYVLRPLLESGYYTEIICADNGSSDGSPEIARSLGARVTHCAELGYGATCLRALEDIRERGGCDVVLFTDADGADDPAEATRLIAPLLADEPEQYDLSLGARVSERADPGALLPQARLGNWLATNLMRIFWKHRYLDLGPYRAIRWEALERLRMDDRNFGWTIQMQIRALKAGLRVIETPVHYRKRHAGKSKVTANLRAAIKAGRIILWTVFDELRRRTVDGATKP